jgi:hypothetical protein
VNYKIDFWPPHSLFSNSSLSPKIVITMPAGLTLSPTCGASNIIGLSTSLTCTVSTSSRTYTLTNLNTYTPSSSPILSVNISSLSNGLVSGAQGTFQINTFMTEAGQDYRVDSYSSPTIISMVPGSINSPSIISSSYLALNNSQSYTFNITPADTIP